MIRPWCVALFSLFFLLPAAASVAAEQDNAVLIEQAQRYEHGEGVPADPKRAMDLYCRAARDGSADAAYQLGWMLFIGRGVDRDTAAAAHWFTQAAAKGQKQAAAALERFRLAATGAAPLCAADTPPPRPEIAIVAPPEILAMVNRMAPGFGLDPKLVLAVIRAESAFRSDAVSPKNAIGLMQVLPETAARFGVANPFDVKANLTAGMRYLRWLMAYFKGDVTRVLAAYNAGEQRVIDYKGVPPFAETRTYIQRIRTVYAAEHHPFDPRITSGSQVF